MGVFCAALCILLTTYFATRGDASNPAVIQVSQENKNQLAYLKGLNQSITIVGNDFMLNGQPLHIVSGSLHYFRLPAAYWRDRLRKLKAAGLNSVATYVEWSYHEPEWRKYSFEGDRDIVAFIRTAAEEGLHVLLRPGPYICAERDLGGFPYWLLGKYPEIRLRTTDKDFIKETKIWIARLFEEVKPLLFGNGGPIILVQVENEYGSYGSDMPYKEQMRDIILEHTGTAALLYTTDGAYTSYFTAGHIPGVLTTIDFGTGFNVNSAITSLRKLMPSGPVMNSEYYPGWLTHWGEQLQQVSTDSVVNTLREMLDKHLNVNFYMFFGGSNFEYSAGANFGSRYQPDITSYDYDAPLTEAGDPTPKYYAIRNLLKQYNFSDENIPEPTPSPKGAYGQVTVTPRIKLLDPQGRSILGKAYGHVSGSFLPTFEQVGQRSGLVLYETTIDQDGVLRIEGPRDWIYVYVDGKLQGVINRMYQKYSLRVKGKANSLLSLLVENQGRINYGPRLHDRKGIMSLIKFNNQSMSGHFNISGYPLEVLNTNEVPLVSPPDINNGPVLFEGEFVLPNGQNPLDTFLDTTGWGRGYVWINGHNLGRYWPGLGPQVTLYVPGVWLKAAPEQNRIQILELEKVPVYLTMEFIDYPILNRTADHYNG